MIPDWMADLTISDLVVSMGGILAGLWITVKVVPLTRKLSHLLDDLLGTPARAGVEAKAGIMERVAAMEKQVATIHHETTPNHGGSIKDAVGRIEAGLTTERTTLQDHITETEPLMPMLRDLHRKWADQRPNDHERGDNRWSI